MQKDVNKQILYNLFQAYYDARKNKRNTLNQLAFESNLESNIINLRQEIISGNYQVGRSIYFIQNYPVKREIFAGDFRDRVVHHLVYNYISPIFEKEFIYDSYSCRKGKGTSFGVKRIEKFIRSCSDNCKEDCYILKLDISGYFMSMDKDILFRKIEKVLNNNYTKIQTHSGIPSLEKGRRLQISPFYKGSIPSTREEGLEKTDYNFIINLIKIIIYNDPTKNGIFKGKISDYLGLPKNKSLFFAKLNCGLPIGNLTSQLFSNIYLSDFDKFVKGELNIKYYCRYVDDFIIIHKDKEYLKLLIPKINTYLKNNLGLTLHPKKIYLQHFTKGVLFLGVFIKPYRTYIRKRTIGYFYTKIQVLNKRLANNLASGYSGQARVGQMELDNKLKQDFLSIINSYLGFLKHHKTYKKRKHLLLKQVSAYFWNYFYVSSGYINIKLKNTKSYFKINN